MAKKIDAFLHSLGRFQPFDWLYTQRLEMTQSCRH